MSPDIYADYISAEELEWKFVEKTFSFKMLILHLFPDGRLESLVTGAYKIFFLGIILNQLQTTYILMSSRRLNSKQNT